MGISTAGDPPSPLNQFGGVDAGQTFRATFDAASFPGTDTSLVRDVVLVVEYSARL